MKQLNFRIADVREWPNWVVTSLWTTVLPGKGARPNPDGDVE
jgi:hypothetical protein